MTPLPIDRAIPEIVARVREARSLVLVAPPGAGKTTRVPPALLKAGLLSPEHPSLVMLQPRRVAARASALRIAEEQGWTLGREVGYHVRFEKKVGPDTRLRVLTEGILTRQLLDDPFLEGVGCVILDEFHERSIHTDVCAALLREVRQTVRNDLVLVVMSATLDAEPVARFLGDCPVVRTVGRTFPVEVEYTGWSQDYVSDRAADAVGRVLSGPDRSGTGGAGDVLVFLPGAEEIRRTMGRLAGITGRDDLAVLPLHGSMPFEEQVRALRPAGRRKVILATNIAETSLTIEGVTTVVDSGLARVAGYDPRRGLDRLELQRISKASAAQRAGRAGRTGPGRCLRLWSQAEERAMPDFLPAEVHRVDLCGAVLMLHAWGKPDPRAFGWYEAPPEEMLASAERLLEMLGALTSEKSGQITPLGRKILSLPVHPRLARLLLAAAEAGAAEEGAAVAALLSEKDIVYEDRQTPPWAREAKTQGASDLLIRLDLLGRAEGAKFAAHLRDEGIDVTAARQVAKTRDELLRVARRHLSSPSPGSPGEGRGEGLSQTGGRARFQTGPHPNPLPEYRERGPEAIPRADLLLKLPLLAYPDRVCRRRTSDPGTATMVGGGGVKLAAESIVRQPEFFLALDARQDERSRAREALVRVASEVRVEWLEELFPHETRREQAAVFDPQRQRVVGVTRTWYRDLLLRETTGAAVDPDAGAAALAEALRPRLAEVFASNEPAATLLARVDLLRRHMPEHPWPAFDEDALNEVLVEAARAKRGLEEVRAAPLAALLQSRLPYPLDRLLEQHAPDAIEVPTGNRIRLTYTAGQAPVLAVRLQEVFGWTDTPRIAGGRLPVLLHLLGPNFRPVQITDDLRSFWSTTYFQVRKDLRTRYPKHSWPEDPLSAKPEAKGGRRRG